MLVLICLHLTIILQAVYYFVKKGDKKNDLILLVLHLFVFCFAYLNLLPKELRRGDTEFLEFALCLMGYVFQIFATSINLGEPMIDRDYV